MKQLYFLLITLLFMSSCGRRNIAYFNDLVDDSNTYSGQYALPQVQEIRIGDLLGIVVNSPSLESNKLFNLPVTSVGGQTSEAGAVSQTPGYLVDPDGRIEFPVVGFITVAGKTQAQLRDELKSLLAQYLKDPVVNVRQLNATITVLGEVMRPGTYPINGSNVTLLQALGLAGDLTVFGKRDDITIIREVNGERTAVRLDLTTAAALQSPYYFLQSNDVVYVEPFKTKEEQSSLTRSNISIVVSVLSIITFLIVGR